jgi:hypothetical protein
MQQPPPQPAQPPKKSPVMLYILVGLVAVSVAGAAYYMFFMEKPDSDYPTGDEGRDALHQAGSPASEGGQQGTEVQATSSCGGMECFGQKFAECEPAMVELRISQNLVYLYDIIGPKEGGCEVKSTAIKNPNSAWIGKEMYCLYDNQLDFDTAAKDQSRCAGELYELMTGTSIEVTDTDEASDQPQRPPVTLTIAFPSPELEQEERALATIEVSHEGERFKSALLFTVSREGYDKTVDLHEVSSDTNHTFTKDLTVGISDTAAAYPGTFHNNPGRYTFNVSLYDCEQVEEFSTITCELAAGVMTSSAEANQEERVFLLAGLEPLASASASLTVTGERTAPVQIPREADVIFDIDNTTLKTNDTFVGMVVVRSLNPQYNARIIDRRWEQGNSADEYKSNERVILGQDNAKPGIEQHEIILKAFGDDNESYAFDLEKFPRRGTYHFSVKVFDCGEIQEELDPVSYCGSDDDPIEERIEPLASEEVAITVN